MTRRSGVTLSEILIAIATISITLLALAALQGSILKGRQKSLTEVHAAKLASAIMIRLENQLSADIDQNVAQPRTPVPPELLADNRYGFEYEVQQSFDGPPEDRLKDVSVTIFWKDKNGPQSRTVWSKFVEQ
jgi:Tfp pilus assembly protein PilV